MYLGHKTKGLGQHLWDSAATHNSSRALLELCSSPGNKFQVQSKHRSHKHLLDTEVSPDTLVIRTPISLEERHWLTISRAPRSTPHNRLE